MKSRWKRLHWKYKATGALLLAMFAIFAGLFWVLAYTTWEQMKPR